jgi:hypothetical protein
MDRYIKARPKYEVKVERPKEKKEYGRPVMNITEDIDLHDGFMIKIQEISHKKIDTKEHGIYQNLLIDLRRAYGLDEITKTQFDYYKSLADQVIDKEIAKTSKKSNSRSKQKDSEIETTNDRSDSKNKEVEIRENNPDGKKKVRGEESLGDKLVAGKEELKLKMNKWDMFKEFIGSPVSRILLFVVLAVFLMFYITKTNMADLMGSPMILILAIVFIIIIVGRGGKTRQHTYADDQRNY